MLSSKIKMDYVNIPVLQVDLWLSRLFVPGMIPLKEKYVVCFVFFL